jgi:hypothetical protein
MAVFYSRAMAGALQPLSEILSVISLNELRSVGIDALQVRVGSTGSPFVVFNPGLRLIGDRN